MRLCLFWREVCIKRFESFRFGFGSVDTPLSNHRSPETEEFESFIAKSLYKLEHRAFLATQNFGHSSYRPMLYLQLPNQRTPAGCYWHQKK